ncbi:MAG: COG4705 family protein, partial [Candidatus Saccharimonadales bacterium]
MIDSHSRLIRKVPEITAIFWLAKLLTTAMGESTSDYFVFRINPYIAVILGGIVFAVALAIQFSARKYVPWIYWFAVTMVAVFGTMAADVLHIQLHVPYTVSTIFFAIVLALVFTAWHKTQKTLSIHTVNNPRRELFYWAAVLATFALGTAAGDWAAVTLGLGYFSAGLVFAGIILIPALGFWLFGLNEILSFWFAYVITRPLGASFADWFGKSQAVGGRGYGDSHVSLVLTGFIILC